MAKHESVVLGDVLANRIDVKTLKVGGDPLNGTDATALVTGATITVGDEAENSINVAVQLQDGAGNDAAAIQHVLCYLSDDSGGDGVCTTAPDGDVAIGTDGTIICEHVTDKVFQIMTEADGEFDLDIGEAGGIGSGTGSSPGVGILYLVVVLPTGKQVVSGAITFAA